MIKNVGITGNIGSGKSTVAHLFELMGIPIYVADKEARKFFLDQTIITEITKIAGTRILDDQQKINRSLLAEILFSTPELLSAVNHIVHPRVIKDYLNWSTTQTQAPFTLFESAIIYEHGLETNFDKIIDIFCPEEIAIKRATKRDHQTANQVKSRLAYQMNSEIKSRKADYVIYTDDHHSIISQVLSIIEVLHKK